MQIVKEKINISVLREMSKKMFGNLVKAVVDVEEGIVVIDGELHADELAVLIENGSEQKNLWGINIYPEKKGEDFIEFDSVINIRPNQGNHSRGVEDEQEREKIVGVVNKLIQV